MLRPSDPVGDLVVVRRGRGTNDALACRGFGKGVGLGQQVIDVRNSNRCGVAVTASDEDLRVMTAELRNAANERRLILPIRDDFRGDVVNIELRCRVIGVDVE